MACSFVSYFKNAQPATEKGNTEQPINKLRPGEVYNFSG